MVQVKTLLNILVHKAKNMFPVTYFWPKEYWFVINMSMLYFKVIYPLPNNKAEFSNQPNSGQCFNFILHNNEI